MISAHVPHAALVLLQASATLILARLSLCGHADLRTGRWLMTAAAALMTLRRVTAWALLERSALATADRLSIPLAISGFMLGAAWTFLRVERSAEVCDA